MWYIVTSCQNVWYQCLQVKAGQVIDFFKGVSCITRVIKYKQRLTPLKTLRISTFSNLRIIINSKYLHTSDLKNPSSSNVQSCIDFLIDFWISCIFPVTPKSRTWFETIGTTGRCTPFFNLSFINAGGPNDLWLSDFKLFDCWLLFTDKRCESRLWCNKRYLFLYKM